MKNLSLVFSLLLVACNAEAPLPTLAPTLISKTEIGKPLPTSTGVPPTAALAITAVPQFTPAPPLVSTAVPLKGEITLWHTYEAGEVEEKVFLQVVENLKKKNPELKLTVQRILVYEAAQRFRLAVKTGATPDLLFASNDDLGDWVRDKAVLDLTPYLNNRLNNVSPNALDALKVEGKLYGIPESVNTVVLYYNKTLIDKPPTTTDELLNLVKNKKELAAVSGAYHLYGFFPAFGGKLLDENNKCIAEVGGFSETMHYLAELKNAGAILDSGDATLVTSFLEGKTAMLINTTWALADYRQALGDKLGGVPLPAHKNKASPFTFIDAFYVNPNSKAPALAVEVALALTNQAAAQIFVDQASHLPIRTDLKLDSLMTNLTLAATAGTPRPQSKEFQNYWQPFNELFVRVLDLKTPPADAVKQACAAMNKANGK